MLEQTASRPNHTPYRNFYIIEFVQNSLYCNMVIVIFEFQGLEALRGKNTIESAHFGTQLNI